MRAEYITLAKKRLVLASAPYAPQEASFSQQGHNHTISNFIMLGAAARQCLITGIICSVLKSKKTHLLKKEKKI